VPVRLAGADALHLARTLHSGQTFRWTSEIAEDGATLATGVVGRDVFRLRQDDRGLWLLAPSTAEARAEVRRYLGLAHESGTVDRIETALSDDAVLARVLQHTRGTGILAQDPWEVLISFIISQNNNIPKIRQSIEGLARSLGVPLDGGAFAFPTPERLARAHLRTLAACLLGYRAPYVRAAARLIAEKRIEFGALVGSSTDHARDRLLGIPGVGEKVADCVLLFGLRHTTAFPVDIWVQRAVERLYFHGRPRTVRQIQGFARARFGALAGYAQQHLFCYARAHLRPKRQGPRRIGPGPRSPYRADVPVSASSPATV
jgi:N-glycosylase/DNA lyase